MEYLHVMSSVESRAVQGLSEEAALGAPPPPPHNPSLTISTVDAPLFDLICIFWSSIFQ